jgi:hypothetical protein
MHQKSFSSHTVAVIRAWWQMQGNKSHISRSYQLAESVSNRWADKVASPQLLEMQIYLAGAPACYATTTLWHQCQITCLSQENLIPQVDAWKPCVSVSSKQMVENVLE